MAQSNPRKVYVANLPDDCDVARLKAWCAQAGRVFEANICKKRSSGGFVYGFVTYASMEGAERALKELDNKPFDNANYMVTVRPALDMVRRSRRYVDNHRSRSRSRSRSRDTSPSPVAVKRERPWRRSPSPLRRGFDYGRDREDERDRERDRDRGARRREDMERRAMQQQQQIEQERAIDTLLRDQQQQQQQQQPVPPLPPPAAAAAAYRFHVPRPPGGFESSRARVEMLLKLAATLTPEELQSLPPTESYLLQALQNTLLGISG